MSSLKPIPENSSVLIPMLVCSDPSAEVNFCKTTFGALELGSRPGPDGALVHALMSVGGAMVIIEGEWPTIASRAPQPDGSSPVVIFVYVENVDSVMERAVSAGARILLPAKDQFWGDRKGRIMDPMGHVWTISNRVEETSSEERQERWSSIVKG